MTHCSKIKCMINTSIMMSVIILIVTMFFNDGPRAVVIIEPDMNACVAQGNAYELQAHNEAGNILGISWDCATFTADPLNQGS